MYKAEGVDVSSIEFKDNSATLVLLEARARAAAAFVMACCADTDRLSPHTTKRRRRRRAAARGAHADRRSFLPRLLLRRPNPDACDVTISTAQARKPMGIFPLLDDELAKKSGATTDLTFLGSVMKTHFDAKPPHPNLQRPRGAASKDCFEIVHYAGNVQYNVAVRSRGSWGGVVWDSRGG